MNTQKFISIKDGKLVTTDNQPENKTLLPLKNFIIQALADPEASESMGVTAQFDDKILANHSLIELFLKTFGVLIQTDNPDPSKSHVFIYQLAGLYFIKAGDKFLPNALIPD